MAYETPLSPECRRAVYQSIPGLRYAVPITRITKRDAYTYTSHGGLREAENRRLFGRHGHHPEQRAVDHQQQGASEVRLAAENPARWEPYAVRRAAAAAARGARDGVYRAVQRPPA